MKMYNFQPELDTLKITVQNSVTVPLLNSQILKAPYPAYLDEDCVQQTLDLVRQSTDRIVFVLMKRTPRL